MLREALSRPSSRPIILDVTASDSFSSQLRHPLRLQLQRSLAEWECTHDRLRFDVM